MNDPIDLVDLDGRLAHLREDTARFAACLENGDLGTEIAACPGWDLRRLAGHLGGVHRWATHAIQDAALPTERAHRPPDDIAGPALAAWLRLGAGVLADVLATTRPNSRTWHPFAAGQVAWVWSRRQTVETALHRWDAEMAVAAASSLDPSVAAMGIGEYFHLGLPRILSNAGMSAPVPSLHVQHRRVVAGRVRRMDRPQRRRRVPQRGSTPQV